MYGTKKKVKGYSIGGRVNGMNEETKYGNTSVNRSTQGMMSARGAGAGDGQDEERHG